VFSNSFNPAFDATTESRALPDSYPDGTTVGPTYIVSLGLGIMLFEIRSEAALGDV